MKKVWIAVSIAVGVMLLLWGVGWWAMMKYIPIPSERGQFGDMFGSVNALFSSLALVGVIAAILIQKEELELQRKELEMTRNEMIRSAEAQRDTADAMKEQVSLQLLAAKINSLSTMLEAIESSIARNELAEKLHGHDPRAKPLGKKISDEIELRNKFFNQLQTVTMDLNPNSKATAV